MDVIIIGTGPAGFAAAQEISSNGYKVTLLSENRKAIIGDQPSQTVHPGMESLLDYLGVPGLLEKVARSSYNGIWTNGNYRPLNERSEESWSGFHIDRAKFDLEIWNELSGRGITVIQNFSIGEVEIDEHIIKLQSSDGRTIKCRYLIDASGSGRVMSKRLPFQKHIYSPALIACSVLLKGIPYEVFADLKTSFSSDENGWTWMAPEKPDRCTWTRLSVDNDRKAVIPAEFEHCEVGPMLQSNVRWNILRPLFYKSVVLCGEAGAILDPGTGQGILTALLSGIKAGKAIVQCLQDASGAQSFLEEYDEWFFNHFMKNAATLYEYYNDMNITAFSNTHLTVES